MRQRENAIETTQMGSQTSPALPMSRLKAEGKKQRRRDRSMLLRQVKKLAQELRIKNKKLDSAGGSRKEFLIKEHPASPA